MKSHRIFQKSLHIVSTLWILCLFSWIFQWFENEKKIVKRNHSFILIFLLFLLPVLFLNGLCLLLFFSNVLVKFSNWLFLKCFQNIWTNAYFTQRWNTSLCVLWYATMEPRLTNSRSLYHSIIDTVWGQIRLSSLSISRF